MGLPLLLTLSRLIWTQFQWIRTYPGKKVRAQPLWISSAPREEEHGPGCSWGWCQSTVDFPRHCRYIDPWSYRAQKPQFPSPTQSSPPKCLGLHHLNLLFLVPQPRQHIPAGFRVPHRSAQLWLQCQPQNSVAELLHQLLLRWPPTVPAAWQHLVSQTICGEGRNKALLYPLTPL